MVALLPVQEPWGRCARMWDQDHLMEALMGRCGALLAPVILPLIRASQKHAWCLVSRFFIEFPACILLLQGTGDFIVLHRII